jgi:hypothetical protein
MQVPWQLPVELAGRQYQIDPKKFSRSDLPALRQQVDQGEQAGAQTLSLEGSWTRGATDWTMGDSQETYDLPSSDAQRYGESLNTQSIRLGRFQLSPALQSRSTTRSARGAGMGQVVLCGNWMYFIDTSSGHVYAGDISGGPYAALTLADKLTPASTCTMLATDGSSTVWAITLSDGIYRTTSGNSGGSLSSWSSSSTLDGTAIGFCNGRLLIANSNVISEVDSTPTATVIHTYPSSISHRVGGFIGTPGAIYILLTTRNEIHVIDDVDPTGALSPPRVAGVLAAGEIVTEMVQTSGILIFSTNLGLRLAVPSGDGSLTLGNIVTPRSTPSSGIASNCTGLAVMGNNVFFAASPSTYSIGRLDLANFVGPLTPAVHSVELDTGSSTSVISHLLYYSGGDQAIWVHAIVGSTAQIWGFSNEALTLFTATARQKEASGYRYSGWLGYGITELKQPVVVNVIHEALPAGSSVAVAIVADDGTETTIGTQTATGSTLTTFSIDSSTIGPQRKFQVKLTLTRGTDDTTSPVIESWAVRAMPIPQRQEEILLSILMRPVVEQGDDGNRVQQDLADEYTFLAGLRDARTPVDVSILGRTSKVVVDRVAWPQGEVERISNGRDEFVGTLYVRLLTVA